VSVIIVSYLGASNEIPGTMLNAFCARKHEPKARVPPVTANLKGSGSILNKMQELKETFNPPTDYRYSFMGE
jgi:hypothetical protein